MERYNHKIGKTVIPFAVKHDGWGIVTGYTFGNMEIKKNKHPYGYKWDVLRDGEYITSAGTRSAAMTKAVDIYLEDVRLY